MVSQDLSPNLRTMQNSMKISTLFSVSTSQMIQKLKEKSLSVAMTYLNLPKKGRLRKTSLGLTSQLMSNIGLSTKKESHWATTQSMDSINRLFWIMV